MNIEIKNNKIIINSDLDIALYRTIKLPNNKAYNLPSSLGQLPIKKVSDYINKVPRAWIKTQGVFIPISEKESFFINLNANDVYALKIASNKLNLINGKKWTENLDYDNQDYFMSYQPFIDGYRINNKQVAQFNCDNKDNNENQSFKNKHNKNYTGLQFKIFKSKGKTNINHRYLYNSRIDNKETKHLENYLRTLAKNPSFKNEKKYLANPNPQYLYQPNHNHYYDSNQHFSGFSTSDNTSLASSQAALYNSSVSNISLDENNSNIENKINNSLYDYTEQSLMPGALINQKTYINNGFKFKNTESCKLYIHFVDLETYYQITNEVPLNNNSLANLEFYKLIDNYKTLKSLDNFSQLNKENNIKNKEFNKDLIKHLKKLKSTELELIKNDIQGDW